MAAPLPPDLARVGDELEQAVDRQVARLRRRPRRLSTAAIAAALAFAALTPTAIDPSMREEPITQFADALRADCAQPRLAPPPQSECDAYVMVLYRPYAVR